MEGRRHRRGGTKGSKQSRAKLAQRGLDSHSWAKLPFFSAGKKWPDGSYGPRAEACGSQGQKKRRIFLSPDSYRTLDFKPFAFSTIVCFQTQIQKM